MRISAVPAEEYCFGGLAALDLRRLNKTLKKRFERAKFPLAFAGVDISLNLLNNAIARAYWQPHLYGLVVGLTPDQVEASLSAYYPVRGRAKKPLYVCHCRKLTAVLSYCIKPYFSRHSGHRDPDNGRKNNEAQPLKGYQMQELGVWLDQYEREDRYLLHGCRKRGSRIVVNPAVRAELLGHSDRP